MDWFRGSFAFACTHSNFSFSFSVSSGSLNVLKKYTNISQCHLIGMKNMLCVCALPTAICPVTHSLFFSISFPSSLFLSLLPSPTFREECFREGTHQIILHLPGAYAEMCVCWGAEGWGAQVTMYFTWKEEDKVTALITIILKAQKRTRKGGLFSVCWCVWSLCGRKQAWNLQIEHSRNAHCVFVYYIVWLHLLCV